MFGYDYEITNECPNYFLDYQEHFETDPSIRWTDRVNSSTGEWSGNLFDFFYKVATRLTQNVKRPFKLAADGFTRIDDTDVHKAIREALANSLVNADYYGRRGLVIKNYLDRIEISNPGSFRVPLADAIGGGVSDPRNAVILKMFNLIDIGERAGSGIPNIYSVWKSMGTGQPTYLETYEPDRVTLTLFLAEANNKAADKLPINTADKLPINCR
jgi:predicted HTH transcriptional regulator